MPNEHRDYTNKLHEYIHKILECLLNVCMCLNNAVCGAYASELQGAGFDTRFHQLCE